MSFGRQSDVLAKIRLFKLFSATSYTWDGGINLVSAGLRTDGTWSLWLFLRDRIEDRSCASISPIPWSI